MFQSKLDSQAKGIKDSMENLDHGSPKAHRQLELVVNSSSIRLEIAKMYFTQACPLE